MSAAVAKGAFYVRLTVWPEATSPLPPHCRRPPPRAGMNDRRNKKRGAPLVLQRSPNRAPSPAPVRLAPRPVPPRTRGFSPSTDAGRIKPSSDRTVVEQMLELRATLDDGSRPLLQRGIYPFKEGGPHIDAQTLFQGKFVRRVPKLGVLGQDRIDLLPDARVSAPRLVLRPVLWSFRQSKRCPGQPCQPPRRIQAAAATRNWGFAECRGNWEESWRPNGRRIGLAPIRAGAFRGGGRELRNILPLLVL